MDNFANYRYTLDKNRLGKYTLDNFTNGNLTLCNFTHFFTMYKFTKGYGYGINKNVILFYDYYYSEFNSDRCVKVLDMKKDKFTTKIA